MLEKGHKRKSFSLAEVLVTLTIIGVVAAMTIPQLIQSYQNQEYVTRLKKAYTTTNQALQQMAADMGCTSDLKCTGLFTDTSSHETIGNELVKYFNVTKNCKTATIKDCWASKAAATGYYKFIISDGTAFSIEDYKESCITDGSGLSINMSTGRTGNMTQTCGNIIIDVNGLKPPNVAGRDRFFFFITNGKGPLLYPHGGADANWNDGWSNEDSWWLDPSDEKTPRYCTNKNTMDYSCTGRVIEEGWAMNY